MADDPGPSQQQPGQQLRGKTEGNKFVLPHLAETAPAPTTDAILRALASMHINDPVGAAAGLADAYKWQQLHGKRHNITAESSNKPVAVAAAAAAPAVATADGELGGGDGGSTSMLDGPAAPDTSTNQDPSLHHKRAHLERSAQTEAAAARRKTS